MTFRKQPRRPQFGGMKDEPEWPESWDRPLADREADAFWRGAGRMRRFCAFGFLLGVVLSGVLLAVDRLTGFWAWYHRSFLIFETMLWPFAWLLLIDIDVELSRGAILSL